MTVSLKHAFTSAKADGGDTTLVQPSNWNAEHTLTMATARLLGRTTAGTGAAEEISVGTGLSLSGGSLSNSGVTSYPGAGLTVSTGSAWGTSKTAPTGDVVGTTDTQTLSAKTITGTKETVFTITDGSSVDIDPANGGIQTWTLGASRTPTATNFTAGQSVTLLVDDGSAYTITWTTIGVTWLDSASAPTLQTTGYTIIELFKVSTTVYGLARR